MKEKKSYQNRIHLIDTIRGIIIIGVVLYHMVFDLVFLFGFNIPFLTYPSVNFIRDFGAGMLIFISGIASNLSHSNLKRGLQCLFVALVFSVVTFTFIPDEFIYFGVLHLLGTCMVAYHFYKKPLKKVPVWTVGVLFSVFLLLFGLSNGYIGLFGHAFISLPDNFHGNVVLYCLGFPYDGQYSADYFPIIPWLLLFVCGNIIGRYFESGRIPKFFYKDLCPPVTYIGTKTLYIYVLHQPIVYGILNLIFLLSSK